MSGDQPRVPPRRAPDAGPAPAADDTSSRPAVGEERDAGTPAGAESASASPADGGAEPDRNPDPGPDAGPDAGPGADDGTGAVGEDADADRRGPVTADAGAPETRAGGAEPGGAPAGSTATPEAPVGGSAVRRRRDPLAAALIGVLTLLLGFAIAVQVRNTDADQQLAGAREEDLVGILDSLNAQEDRLREQIADQRSALEQLTSTDSRSAAALEEARQRAEAIGILNGSVAARGPGLEMSIRDPEGEVRVADILDAIQELRGAGAETMQIDDVRVGVSTAVTGTPGALEVDGRPITSPYRFLVIGDPQNMETAMNIPGGVVQRIAGRGGSVTIVQSQDIEVTALRPLDTPQYASPATDD